MPYIIQHSSNNQITLPVDCANLNDTHLVDDNTYMNTSLNHSFPHTTVMNSNTSENFSPTNNTGQMQCTLLTPTPYTQDLKVDQPIFILSSVVSNNHSNQNILNTNLTSSVNMEPERKFLELFRLLILLQTYALKAYYIDIRLFRVSP